MAAPAPTPQPRQTCPPLAKAPCPQCREVFWCIEEDLLSTPRLHWLVCTKCGFIAATWERGQADWVPYARRRATLAEQVQVAQETGDGRRSARIGSPPAGVLLADRRESDRLMILLEDAA